jgi:asparagine synthase (glutamine-hydrolysing)
MPPPSRGQALERIEEALVRAVERRLVSDVPVCLFLSGGIDSSLIASALSKTGPEKPTAYTIGYGADGYDEFEFARTAAKRFGLRHEEIRLSLDQARESLSDPAAVLDEPMSDWVWVPLHHLSRRARQDGFKVALLGEGSDELFFGYDVMLKGYKRVRRWEPRPMRTAARWLSRALAPVYYFSSRGHSRYDLLRRSGAGEPVYMGSSIGWARSQRRQVAGPELLKGGDPNAGVRFISSLEDSFGRQSPKADRLNRICYVEFYSKMGEVLLQRVDRVSMLHSLEARCPFLDHELIELAFSLPGDWKVQGGRLKSLLKDLAARSLPPELITRPKMGFSFPFKEWLRGGLGAEVEGAFKSSRLIKDGWVNGKFALKLLAEHRSGFQDHAPRLWALYDLCRWYDRWIA